MIHGWPGSFAEFTEIAGPLVDPVAHGGEPQDAFHLVLPSIPGYGFSGPTIEPGWHERRVAAAFIELMRRLGHERYVTQGGDWGAAISREMGRTEPHHVIGVHLNLLVNGHASEKPDPTELGLLSPAERDRTIASWAAFQEWLGERAGYAAVQSTRPQTRNR